LADVEWRKTGERSKTCANVGMRRFAIEVTGMTLPVNEAARCYFRFAHTLDIDQTL
jgi:hypothetical protein